MRGVHKLELPLGYKVNALACGIKKSGKPDLGLIFSPAAANAVGVFTTSKIVSGSVEFSKANLKKSLHFQAIIANSGNANCFTRDDSFQKAQDVAVELAGYLQIKPQEVLLASTGIIGRLLPVERIKKVIPTLVSGLKESGLAMVARSIMTTDTFPKIRTVTLEIGQKVVTICGLAKGAGMIAPDLAFPTATMLCFILSDANIAQTALEIALKEAVDSSFNCITIDGCMSTNDTVFLMSNSCANNPEIQKGTSDFNRFCSVLNNVCLDLAKMIIKDAEGATKFIQIKIKQAKSFQEARQAALSIANYNLFKAAMFGRSRNLGRIAAALGASGIDVKETDLRIKVSSLNKNDICIEATLKRGSYEAVVYTSDLTPEYVKINAQYS